MIQKRWVTFLLGFSLLLAFAGGCSTSSHEPLMLEAQGGDESRTAVTISPGIVGPNQYKISITDKNNQPQKAENAKLYFSMAGMEHGKSVEELKPQSDGTWAGEGPHIMMPGIWQLKLEWKDATGKTQTMDYELELEE